jgi:uncharacterized protein YjlB
LHDTQIKKIPGRAGHKFCSRIDMANQPTLIHCEDNGVFPNSKFPVLLYKAVLEIPALFPAQFIKGLFDQNNWTNSWKSGIFNYHHYHSNTHEALGVYDGSTTLQLGGDNGPTIQLQKGDVLVIPAGVAHKNLGEEDRVKCVGAYPDGRHYDMNYGSPGERPHTDQDIASVPMPAKDPVFGLTAGLPLIWPVQGHAAPSIGPEEI